MSLNCSEIQEMFRRMRVQTILKPFLLSYSFCQEANPSLNWPVRSSRKPWLEQFCQIVTSYCSIFFSNWIVMSQWSDHKLWYFQTTLAEFAWFNVYPFSLTIRNRHKRQRSSGVGRGLAFATGFPVLLHSTLVTEISSDLSVTYLLIAFTTRTQETIRSRNKDSIMISTPWRPWWSQTFTSRTGPILCFHGSTSHVWWFFTSR